MFVTIGAIAHSHLGACPPTYPENFGISNSLSKLLGQSEVHFRAGLVQLLYIVQ